MQVKLDGPKVLSPQTIAGVLDYLARKPFVEVQALIGDIIAQLKLQEGGSDGPKFAGSDKNSAGRGDSSSGDSGVPPLES